MGEVLATPSHEIVDDDDLIPAVEQYIDEVTADHAGAAGNDNPHGVPQPVVTGAALTARQIHGVINALTPDRSGLEKPYPMDERAVESPVDGKRRDHC